jgi:hypothetical protein
VWSELGNIIISIGVIDKALTYLHRAYKVTGDVPGINYLLAALYARNAEYDKSYTHLAKAIENDKEIFSDFKEIFPTDMQSRKIKRLLEINNLL